MALRKPIVNVDGEYCELPSGDTVDGVASSDALLAPNRLSEFSTQAAKVAARTNLEVEVFDCGTFN